MTTTGPSTFGALLRAHRLAAGLTQEELAEQAGLSGRGVQDLERGMRRTPQPGTARRLADALGLAGEDRAALLTAGAHGARATPRPMTFPALPVRLTSFVGREHELDELQQRLAWARLLTLVAPGGIGKTRLALEAAGRLVGRYADGVVLVDLAPLGQPELVVQTLAQTLGLRTEIDQPPEAAVLTFLAGRQLLLILDTCEHLVQACAELVAPLLQRSPTVTILATSREPLGVEGEQVWRVGPLDEAAAEHLFVERARAQDADLEPGDGAIIRQVCRALDYLPLAIELAAARAGLLAPAEMLDHLEDRFTLLRRVGRHGGPPRQQTLQATLDWSHELLEPAERRLFRRLAVFPGSFDLAAATAMGGPDTLDVLGRLVDKSLVVAQPSGAVTRYRLLDTVRSYAREQLRTAGEEAAARHCHLQHFLDLAEGILPNLVGPDQARGYERLQLEYDNLRAALESSRDDEQGTDAELRLTAALGRFWYVRGPVEEGQVWLAHALARAEQAPAAAYVRALEWAGLLAVDQADDLERGQRLLATSIPLARQLGDLRLLSFGLRHLALALELKDDNRAARALTREAVQAARSVGDQREVAMGLLQLAAQTERLDGTAAAVDLYQQAVTVARAAGDAPVLAHILLDLGRLAMLDRRFDEALHLLHEALGIYRAVGSAVWEVDALVHFAAVARAQGDPERARAYLQEALPIAHEVGNPGQIAAVVIIYAGVLAALGDPTRAAELFSIEARWRSGQPKRASAMLLHELIPLNYATDLAAVRAQLGETEFATAWERGHSLSLPELMDELRLEGAHR